MAHADSAVGVCAKDAANDLREWPQLLAKGVRSLRVHPYYLSNSQCRAFGQHSSRGGCLILSRDAPHAVRQDFNSTSELVATIVAMSKYWPLGAPVSYLLLDFGAVPADACNTGTDWHTVVAQFANLAQRALKKVALRLVVASAAAKQQCLRSVWSPWVFSYVPGVDPPEAFTSNTPPNDAFQLFAAGNVEAFVDAAARSYGKFANTSGGGSAVLVCESDAFSTLGANQSDVVAATAAYANSTVAMRLPPLIFIGAMDASQCALYASAAPLGALPPPLGAWNLQWVPGAFAPHTSITPLPTSMGFPQYSYFAMSVFMGSDAGAPPTFQVSLLFAADATQPFVNISQFALPLPADQFFDGGVAALSAAFSFTPAHTVTYTLVLGAQLQYALYALQYDVDQLVLQSAGLFSLPAYQLLTQASTALVYSNVRNQLFVVQIFTAPVDDVPCALGLQMWSLPTLQSVEFLPVESEQACILQSNALASINSISVAALEVDASVQTAVGLVDCVPGNFLITAAFDQVDTATGVSYTYSLVACVDVDTLATTAPVVASSTFPVLGTYLGRAFVVARIDAGAFPVVALATTAMGSTFILQAAQDGDCSAGSATVRHRSDAALCTRASVNCAGALTYHYASLGLWLNASKSGARGFGRCSDTIFTGVYDQGTAPSVALFATGDTAAIGVLAMHQGVPSSLGNSSSAIPFDGIVVDRLALWFSADTPRPPPDAASALPVWLFVAGGVCVSLVGIIVLSFVRANRERSRVDDGDDAIVAPSSILARHTLLSDLDMQA